ncbi:hypothetical protein ACFQL4_18495 [Halosimplex aquaticum]
MDPEEPRPVRGVELLDGPLDDLAVARAVLAFRLRRVDLVVDPPERVDRPEVLPSLLPRFPGSTNVSKSSNPRSNPKRASVLGVGVYPRQV